ncbi:uncharacterized protein LOC118725968 isoform X3 [Pipistrellus kuhlii]|uniref:uncharacterized protein LOC118725968 isoform X3 n=1 Tax=Pipistrellus kuhlii TaxID=59472 RepID=UPI001E26FEE1|nr:uncharacterized protein LOC118725968 isoform X3 [Pipistrellus kuhlii]
MEPTSCRYSPLPGDEHPKQMGARKLPVWVGIVGILLGLLVETLKISLEEEKAGGRKQQELVQKLQEQIKSLNQSLQDKSTELDKKSAELQKKSTELQEKYEEVKQLRQENEALVSAKCPPNSGISLRLSMTPVLLTLSLLALLA